MKRLKYIIIFILIISCKNENKTKENNFAIKIDFPDTVFINNFYNGKIDYQNDLDTITTKLLDVKKTRFLEYNFLLANKINYDNNKLKKIVTDTFVAKNNRNIPIYDIRFNKLGINFIDGIIVDEVNIDSMMLRNGKVQPSTRIITNEFRVTKKVFVIERPEK